MSFSRNILKSGLVKFFVALTFFSLTAVTANAQQNFNKSLISGAGPYQTGEVVTYRIEGSCGNLITGCGVLRIEDTLPPELVIASCPVSGFFDSIACTVGGSSIVFTKNTYAGGDAFSLDVNLQVRSNITAAISNIPNRAVASILGAVCPPAVQAATIGGAVPPIQPDVLNCDYASAPVISIAQPTPQYRTSKTRFNPAPPITVVAGQAISYNVRFCSNSATGNMPINSGTLIDTLPIVPGMVAANIEFIEAPGVLSGANTAGNPFVITWNFTNATAPPTGVLGIETTTSCLVKTVTVRYPVGSTGTITNTASATAVPFTGPAPVIGPDNVTDTFSPSDPRAATAKSAPDVSPGGGDIVFSINADTNSSNDRLTNFEVVDKLPSLPLPAGITFLSVTSGQWSNPPDGAVTTDVRATVQFTTAALVAGVCNFAGAVTIPTASNIASPGAPLIFNVPADIPATATCIRWQFSDAGANGPRMPRNWSFTTAPQVTYDVGPSPPVVAPSGLTNCSYAIFTSVNSPTADACSTARVEQPTPSVQPVKSANPTVQSPGNTIDFTISAQHVAGDSTAPIVNPVLSDWLPIQLEFDSVVSTTPPGATVTVLQNFVSTGRTLVKIDFGPLGPPNDTFPVGSAGPSAVIRVRVRDGVPANPSPQPAYVNDLAVYIDPGSSGQFTCANNTIPVADTNNLDNNPATTLVCLGSADFRVSEAFVLSGEKWIEGDPALPNVDDPNIPPVLTDNSSCPDYDTNFGGPAGNFTRLPCVAQTTHGGAFRYRLRLINAGNRPLDEYIAYDVLPFVGDTGVSELLSTQSRDTTWLPALDGAITTTVVVPPIIALVNPGISPTYTTDAKVQVEYTTTPNFCRGQVRTNNYPLSDRASLPLVENTFPSGCTAGVWTTTVPVPASLTTGFRIRAFSSLTAPPTVGTVNFEPGTYIQVEIPMRAPATGAPPSFVGGVVPNVLGNPLFFNPAWNSIAHRVFRADAAPADPNELLPTAEPPKVGIVLPEKYRLGNLVWRDEGVVGSRNNGVAETGEVGINGVDVRLCRDTDAIIGPSVGDDVVGNTTTATLSGQLGKYLFTDLPAGANYYVAVLNPTTDLDLAGLSSTRNDEAAPNSNGDNNDNGLGVNGTALSAACGVAANAVVSGLVALGPGAGSPPTPPEPTNETLRSNDATDDDNAGNSVFPDAASNFSVDFGFAAPSDLGDLPDTAAGVGPANYETTNLSGGPIHPIVTGLQIGAVVDDETDGQPNIAANGDDTNGVMPDDEEGVDTVDLALTVNVVPVVDVRVTNTMAPATSARLCGFIDFNADGDFSDLGETASVAVPNPTNNATLQLTFGAPPVGAAASTFSRFRLSTDTAGACLPNGAASNGEVEDYVVSIVEPTDFGDLPDSGVGTGLENYETLLPNGPRHALRPGLQMAACVDAELNGVNSVPANGDDLASSLFTQGVCAVGNDDEDGVITADLNLIAGAPSNVRVTATNTTGSAARVCGFIDFNADGDFADLNESTTVAVPTGSNNVLFTLNFGAVPDTGVSASFARFRLGTSTAPCDPNGAETDGEVEDYPVLIARRDLGDLPDSGAGVGVNNYETSILNGGPIHPILPTIFLGANVDAEADGQQSAAATGDDIGLPNDDENGVTVSSLAFTAGILQNVAITATNNTGSPARVCGFIDFDRNGSFAGLGVEVAELIVPDGSNNTPLTLGFTAPIGTASGTSFARFRVSTDTAGACAPNGAASNGEVEDYVVQIGRADLGDLPDAAPATSNGNYQTLRGDNGAQHFIVDGLLMGASVDNEADGAPNATADGDDNAGTPDDEDGVTLADLTIIAVTNPAVRVNATNTTGTPAQICGFIDYNADGDFADAGEAAQVSVPTASNNVQFTLNFGLVPANSPNASYARFRLSTDVACAEAGNATDGEVEDYPVVIRTFDSGDLPDTGLGIGSGNYNTLASDAGARHEIIAGIQMGAIVDAEGDGQPNVGATGDDTVGTIDDEDGVTLQAGGYELGSLARVTVLATNTLASNATLCGFIDWNADGDFLDTSEATSLPVNSGSNNASFELNFGLAPLNSAASIFGRFRLSTDAGCSATGDATNGEVEDYVVSTTTNGALSLGNLVWEDLNNNGRFDSATEPGIDNVPVTLFQDANQDCQPDGAPLSSQPTAGGGLYRFIDLVPGFYLVTITPPTSFLGSTGTGLVYAPSGPFEPALDPDNNVNNDDNGTQAGVDIKSCGIELRAKDEPVNDDDADFNSNLTVDFGLVRNFDLALRKRLAPTQMPLVNPGQNVNFEITIFNQGTIPATNVLITDYIPLGMSLNDPSWTSTGAQTASQLIAGPIAAGANLSVNIILRLNSSMPGASYRNLAEITSAQDDAGVPRPDKDSIPDSNPNNDGPPTNDETNNINNDQDDQDFAEIFTPGMVPAWSTLASLILIAFIFVLLQRRRKILFAVAKK